MVNLAKPLAASLALAMTLPVNALAQSTDADGHGPDPGSAEDMASQARRQLARIAALDDDPLGPKLNAVIVTNPAAPEEAARRAGKGLLGGRTVLIKDNVETREWATTAGSLALKDNRTGRDAALVVRLRAAGGVVLGKTNLSEWANIRSSRSSSGWSAVGGQTRNPHAIDRNPCGSSSGSGAAIAAGMAWAGIGTETDGSITCPASVNGIVGFKPTVGLVSGALIVPISHSQDTAGPMAATVADAALLLSAIAEPVAEAPRTRSGAVDFTAGLTAASLKGLRIGILRKQQGKHEKIIALFGRALADLKAAGAELVEIDYQPDEAMFNDEGTVLYTELRADLGAYLQALPGNPEVRSLADVIAFNKAHAAEELRWFGQESFEKAEGMTDTEAGRKARENSLRLAGKDGIDKLLAENKVSLLIAPTEGPAWPINLVSGDQSMAIGAGSLAAIAGYPHLTVPMGAVEGLPIGLSFIGPRWDDKRVLEIGAAYERARTAELAVPSFKRWGE
jgi:amidase